MLSFDRKSINSLGSGCGRTSFFAIQEGTEFPDSIADLPRFSCFMASTKQISHPKRALCLLLLVLLGCASQRYLEPRRTPINPLSDALSLMHREGPQPTGRTLSLLRHYDMLDVFHHNPELALEQLQKIASDEKGAEKIYATAELAYILGIRYQRSNHPGKALDMYSVSVSKIGRAHV